MGRTPAADGVLALQRSAGNAAVGRMLARTETEDYNAALGELSLFYARSFVRRNNTPSTGFGLFDVEYDPLTSELLIKVKCKFTFRNGSAAQYPTAAAADLTWTDATKRSFRRRFVSTIARVWSGRHTYHCTKDWWEDLRAVVRVQVVPVERDEHYTVTLHKIPPGQFRTSSVNDPTRRGRIMRGTAEFDSEDLTYVTKTGGFRQRAAVHEFGHMIGLDDEYNAGAAVAHEALVRRQFGRRITTGPGRRIMQGGETISREHGVTFLEALRRVTGMNDWSHRPKDPRHVPAGEMGDFPSLDPVEIPEGDSVPV